MTLVRYDKNHRRSRAIVHDKTVYFAGQVADDFKADIATQTAQALAKSTNFLPMWEAIARTLSRQPSGYVTSRISMQ